MPKMGHLLLHHPLLVQGRKSSWLPSGQSLSRILWSRLLLRPARRKLPFIHVFLRLNIKTIWRARQPDWPIAAVVVEDTRPILFKLLIDPTITLIVAEHKDRLTRFECKSIEQLLATQGRQVELINLAENGKEDLIHALRVVSLAS